MTDTELNEAVARKMGWTLILDGVPHWICPHCPNAHIFNPDFCHDIKAAWEVVEKYKEIEHEKETLFFQMAYLDADKWDAGWYRYQDCGIVTQSADTAPMAICLAFLKL